jgi:hypothetical protein
LKGDENTKSSLKPKPFREWISFWPAYDRRDSHFLLMQGLDGRYICKFEGADGRTYTSPKSRAYLQKALSDIVNPWLSDKSLINRVTFRDRASDIYISLLRSALGKGEVNVVVVDLEVISIKNKNNFEMARGSPFKFGQLVGSICEVPSLFDLSP